MSIRVDSSSLIAGAVVVGAPGLGVLAEAVPSTGEHGAGYLYDSLEFPADVGKEVRGLITTWPTLGTLTAFEDSSFEYDGPSDSFAFQMYVDGVAVGAPQTVTIMVGSAPSITGITASNITQTGATITVTRSNPAAGMLYLVIVPQGVTPSWSRANIGTNSGWSATTIAYHDADADPGTGSTYVFTPDASGLSAGTAYDLWAAWDDGTTTVGPVASGAFTTQSAGATIALQGGVDVAAEIHVATSSAAEMASVVPVTAAIHVSIQAEVALGLWLDLAANVPVSMSVETEVRSALALASEVGVSADAAVSARTQAALAANVGVSASASAYAQTRLAINGSVPLSLATSVAIVLPSMVSIDGDVPLTMDADARVTGRPRPTDPLALRRTQNQSLPMGRL